MSLLANSNAIESGGYNIDRSLRFRSSASAYLNRTPGSAGNRQTWTWSGWVKRGALGVNQGIISTYTGTASINTQCSFLSNDTLDFYDYDGAAFSFRLTTTQVFRDPSAWYHIVLVLDTTQATSSNRVKIYVNGSQITAFGTATYPSLNYASADWNSNTPQRIGLHNTDYFDGYLAEVNNIDGQALTPSSFGYTEPLTGTWQPLKYMGTYGTNGFYLPFTDNTSATTLAYDKSGNGNNWTPNNISTTAGATYDSMTDVPTLTSATAANYCTFNALYSYVGNNAASYTNGNLTLNGSGAVGYGTFAPNTGKWYYEGTYAISSGSGFIGWRDKYQTDNVEPVYRSNGTTANLTGSPSFNSYSNGDVIGICVDIDNNTVRFYKNGTLQGSGDYTCTSSMVGIAMTCEVKIGDPSTGVWNVNFGQRPFSYTPPSGYKALNTFNLPDPTIKKPNQYMDATLWTGNGASTRTISGTNFQPDFVWTKCRSIAYSHQLYDSVRGFGSGKSLESDKTNVEGQDDVYYGYVSAANSTGFSVANGTDGTQPLAYVNENTRTYVGWQWKAGGTSSSNTSGSITSTVSVNTTAGFSVVTWTSNGVTGATIGHGLGIAPKFMVIKARNTTGLWPVYSSSIGNTGCLFLNTTDSIYTSANFFNNTTPSSTVFTTGASSFGWTNGTTWVAYCFAEIPGFSKFGSYTGNGSSDGPFVYCGFRPKYLLLKRTDTTSDWWVVDTARNTYNVVNSILYPDLTATEATGTFHDFLSNGFKCRDSANVNVSGGTYIYACFSENPFKYSLAR